MAQDTIVTGSKLTAIANAIRTRGGTQAQLTLDQMPQAVADIPGGGGGGFDWSQITGGLRFLPAATQTALDLRGMDTSTFTTLGSMFRQCTTLTSLDLSNWDTSHVTAMGAMFYQCSALTSLDLSSFDTINVTDMAYMFYSCPALTSLDLGSFDTSNVTDMSNMFYWCTHLTSLNLSGFDTGRVTSASSMFGSCTALQDVIWSQKNTVQPLPVSASSAGLTYNNSAKFYVPDALVNDYKAATNWSEIASRIYSINDLPQAVATLYAGHY